MFRSVALFLIIGASSAAAASGTILYAGGSWAAVDRGVPISEIKRKSAIGRDLDQLDAGIAAALGLGR